MAAITSKQDIIQASRITLAAPFISLPKYNLPHRHAVRKNSFMPLPSSDNCH